MVQDVDDFIQLAQADHFIGNIYETTMEELQGHDEIRDCAHQATLNRGDQEHGLRKIRLDVVVCRNPHNRDSTAGTDVVCDVCERLLFTGNNHSSMRSSAVGRHLLQILSDILRCVNVDVSLST